MTSCLGSPFKQFPAVRGKENQFMDKNGRRHHGYETDKAPYPLSYCPEVLEMEALDLVYTQTVKQSVTFVDFPHGPPQRSLSLGCGYGHWVIEAAKEWPNCEFIGFDLMNIQIPLAVLDDSTTRRIKWVHGNFLTNRLPFDDDEFDHIHIARLAKGIPESKVRSDEFLNHDYPQWSSLFEEVLRVLRPGGAVELLEEDIIFPTLPHWFTEPLRVRAGKSQAVHLPDVSEAPPVLAVPDPYHQLPHDHALLESLYYAVFENRFINLKPTAILASSFNAYFSGVWSAPALKFPMPPIRPPPPP
ncbi:S-adenosyl-L-methionine-dependent methyltransferase, partial [Punctularia strigosozonata HHB-11173 SS5]|uniref:S-adenosyl-L-methionine-dependent methyltransferase n=1 Tax=Punctularia strigosozonata (strain HHB-11173) TaxID=741275 RepID=UPI0004417ACB